MTREIWSALQKQSTLNINIIAENEMSRRGKRSYSHYARRCILFYFFEFFSHWK